MAINLRNVDAIQHQALMRLTLRTMGETHRIFGDYWQWLKSQINNATGADGFVEPARLLSSSVDDRFRQAVQRWIRLLEAARENAAGLPFGALVFKHNAYMTGLQETLTDEETANVIGIWQQRRQTALRATQARVYGDGLNLSQRVWRLENDGLQRIRQTLATAFVERTNAADLAARLEPILGADQDMPRWAEDRLYFMTPAERRRSDVGLLRGTENRGEGISYNALRLARTELQFANHAVTTEIAIHSPWVTGRYVRLSPAHPKVDICDTYAAGGPYDKSQEILPLHPQCVTPGQLVTTKQGKIPIEQVQAGDMVLTHQGRYSNVTQAWSRDHSGQVYEFETEQGRFEVTAEHPVLLRRGWVEAQFVQMGDEVLYATDDATLNLLPCVSDNSPAVFSEPSIPLDVMILSRFMPSAVAFNSDLDGGKGEINEVSPDSIFPFVDEIGIIKSRHHGDFKGGWICNPFFSDSKQHGHQSWIILFLGVRDFPAHNGISGGIESSGAQSFSGFTHCLSGFCRPSAVIFGPCDLDGFSPGAHRNVKHSQEFAQHPVSQTVAPKDFGGFQLLNDVDVAKELRCGALVFGLNEEDVEFSAGQAVPSEVRTCDAFHLKAAHGASNHDDLLSSSPDVRWGAESGNSVVSEVANPAQALMNYTTVRAVRQRQYTGLVYNMEVEGDHSYTVNGAIVHNCMCRYEEALMPKSDFANQIKGWLQGENTFLDDYATWLGTRQPTEPLPTSLPLADLLEVWMTQGANTHAALLRLN